MPSWATCPPRCSPARPACACCSSTPPATSSTPPPACFRTAAPCAAPPAPTARRSPSISLPWSSRWSSACPPTRTASVRTTGATWAPSPPSGAPACWCWALGTSEPTWRGSLPPWDPRSAASARARPPRTTHSMTWAPSPTCRDSSPRPTWSARFCPARPRRQASPTRPSLTP